MRREGAEDGRGSDRRRGGRRPSSLRSGLRLVLLAAALGSCALETIPQLEAPNFVDLSGAFQLSHNTANLGEDFTGYQILYRLFDTAEEAAAQDAKVSTLLSYEPTTVFKKMTDKTSAGGLGFGVMQFAYTPSYLSTYGSIDASTLNISNLEKTASVSFNLTNTTWSVDKIGPGSDYQQGIAVAGRALDIEPARSAFQVSNLASTDPDCSIATSTAPSVAYLVLYAVAIGLNYSTFSSYYSLPAVLRGGDSQPMVITVSN